MTHDSEKSSWLTHAPVQFKMLFAFGLLLLLVMFNTLAFFLVQGRVQDARQWTIHTYEVQNGVDKLLVEALNQQTGLRGYRLSGQDRFLATYRKGETGFAEQLASLRFLIRDNAVQLQRVDQVETSMLAWRTEVSKPLIALGFGPQHEAQELLLIDRGKLIFDQLRVQMTALQNAESQLLKTRTETLERTERIAKLVFGGLLVLGCVLVLLSLRLVQRQIAQPLSQLTGLMTRLSDGDQAIEVPSINRRDEIGALARALAVFKQMVIEIEQRNWVKTHASQIVGQLQAATDRKAFADTLTGQLAPLLDAGVAAFYSFEPESQQLHLAGSYGYQQARHGLSSYQLGEGLTGQCARDRKPIVIESVPADYVRIHSGTGEAAPRAIVLLPVQTQSQLLGVLEFGSFARFSAQHQSLLDELLPTVALSLDNLLRALRTRELLEKSQTLGEELQASTEELRTTNESLHAKSRQLEDQSARLMASEEELRVQSEELQVSNEELRQKGSILAEQKKSLEALQADTQLKADELARASQYKSEFLANMSHELRTPLNSLLILSRGLADNEDGNLNADEVESATVIHESGSNLLRLINDILDLSKVEAGKMDLLLEEMPLAGFAATLTRNFRHMAKERGLEFSVAVDADLPATIETDSAKLEQIANNLISNALKFTREGSVRVHIGRAPSAVGRGGDIAIRVTDTGIGIPPEKFDKVFQAFEQADGSTSRHFGGTGLGLSIARGMARLLAGDIRLESTEGVGTTFSLLLPERHGLPRLGQAPAETPQPAAPLPRAPLAKPAAPPSKPQPPAAVLDLPDDRHALKPGDTVILIIEDDPTFARILIDLVRRKGYRALFAGDGENGLRFATQFRPTGILLDVMLPGMDGFSVIERLKASQATRHIPVHFISATEDHSRGLDLGAVGFLTKPVTREALGAAFERLLHFAEGSTRQVLVVDDDSASRLAVRKLVGGKNVEVTEAAGGVDALALLQRQSFDCVILDLGMPDMNGFEFLERASTLPAVPPVVVYSGRDLSPAENLKLREYTDSIVIKGARSPERLLDEVSLFLHSIREAVAPVREVDASLSGRTVLVVDDDMRNIFALSKALRSKGLTVVMAQDGYKAIKQLDENRSIELVLMDIMMPGMDGYQTMGEIRKNPAHARLPIIAVTAKAMRGDREKCLEAGANDYLSKPIDLDQLYSMMRVWLPAR
ncbi:MAG: response regulator [Pseudomonadota bacterium]